MAKIHDANVSVLFKQNTPKRDMVKMCSNEMLLLKWSVNICYIDFIYSLILATIDISYRGTKISIPT